jgi:hypothetical protein
MLSMCLDFDDWILSSRAMVRVDFPADVPVPVAIVPDIALGLVSKNEP